MEINNIHSVNRKIINKESSVRKSSDENSSDISISSIEDKVFISDMGKKLSGKDRTYDSKLMETIDMNSERGKKLQRIKEEIQKGDYLDNSKIKKAVFTILNNLGDI